MANLNRFCSFAVCFGRSDRDGGNRIAMRLQKAGRSAENSKVMQVFIVGSPLETAMALDPKRLRKQIIECEQILAALNGATAWRNHPCVLQYRGYEKWLKSYRDCLDFYVRSHYKLAEIESCVACYCYPVAWHTSEYYDQMKRRLYTKDPQHYAQWAHLGKSLENWYFVEGEWRKYVNGKRIE